MKLKSLILCLLFVIFFPLFSYAQDESELKVVDMKLCTGIENRVPVGEADVFSNKLKKIYCYTEIEGAAFPTKISHVWYFEGEKMAEVFLDVKTSLYRTWSSKSILNSWTGNWKVQVLDSLGNVLKEKSFVIGTGPEYELSVQ